MRVKPWYGGLVFVLMALAIGFASWRVVHSSDATACYACKRAIHAHTKTMAFVKGHSRVFCCPACALSEHEQENKPVTITELTSFVTGAPLSPNDAYVVRGSNVNMCMTNQEMISADKRRAPVVYDRCAPSLVAFAKRTEAVEFARVHGGALMPFREAASAFVK